jgi:small-conductance mechanosensitive channel
MRFFRRSLGSSVFADGNTNDVTPVVYLLMLLKSQLQILRWVFFKSGAAFSLVYEEVYSIHTFQDV